MSNGMQPIKTPIDQGMIARVVQGVRGVLSSWFGPMNPIPPIAPQDEKGRQLDYPVGYNITVQPRQYEPITFPQLRALADNYDLVRLAVETRKDQFGKLEWIIQSTGGDDTDNQAQIDEVTEFFKRPDREHTFEAWLRMLLEDILTIDAPCVYPRLTQGNKVYSLDIIDGATIKRVITAEGRTPDPPDIAYQQILHGVPAFDYTADELIYMPRNLRSHKIYGFSPLEQVIMIVNIALRREIYLLNYYTEGNIPDAFVFVPDTWTPDQIKQFQVYWDTMLEGNLASRRKAKFLPGGTSSRVYETRDPKLKDEFDEWLARVVLYAYSLPPTAFIRQMNRSTGETAQEAAVEEGLAPLMLWVENFITMIIQKYFGYRNLEFTWKQEKEIDLLQQAQINDIYIKNGVLTPDYVRGELGIVIGADEEESGVPNVAPGTKDQTGNTGSGEQPNPITKDWTVNSPLVKLSANPSTISRTRQMVRVSKKKLERTMNRFFLKAKKESASQIVGAYSKIHKADAGDSNIDGILNSLDFKGWAVLVNPIQEILQKLHRDGSAEAIVQIRASEEGITDLLDEDALSYAQERAADLVGMKLVNGAWVENPDAAYAITDSTRESLRSVVSDAIENGWSNQRLSKAIEESTAFSPERSAMIARTETAMADVSGNMAGYRRSGIVSGKKWILGSEHEDDDVCNINANGGSVGINNSFPSGHDAPPAHPNCVCDIIPLIEEEEE